VELSFIITFTFAKEPKYLTIFRISNERKCNVVIFVLNDPCIFIQSAVSMIAKPSFNYCIYTCGSSVHLSPGMMTTSLMRCLPDEPD